MSKPAVHVTAAEISRLAGVTRATVSNWRRRHGDFPAPTAGTESSPAYDLAAVRSWLERHGRLPALSPVDELRTVLRGRAGETPSPALRLLPVVPWASRVAPAELRGLADLADGELRRRVREAAGQWAEELPVARSQLTAVPAAPLLRPLLRCVADEGAARTVEVLAEHLAEDTAGVAGTYRTPPPLADLVVELLVAAHRRVPASVFDPACGTGGLLAAAARAGVATLYGQDLAEAQAILSSVRLAVDAAAARSTVRAGDSLRQDAFPALSVDAVVCSPPFGVRDWGHDELAYDPRWQYGLPPRGESELAWLQHCLAHLAPGGTAVMLMPPGVAERPSGRRIRAELVRAGVLRAVVALPAGLAPPLHVGLHLWVLSPGAGSSHVLFVDLAESGGDQAPPGATRAPTVQELRRTLLDTWRAFARQPEGFEPVPGLACGRPAIDLLDEAVDLTPARHVRSSVVTIAPDQYAAAAGEILSRLSHAAHALAALAGGQDWQPAGAQRFAWRTAAVADLLRGGALTLQRSGPVGRAAQAGDEPTPASEAAERPVLVARDVAEGRSASGVASREGLATPVEIRPGDVILPELLRHTGTPAARVADEADAGSLLGGHLYLLRPDPERLDPWFLAGFLSAEENVHSATTGTSLVRVDVRRLRVPLLPLDQQRRYGQAFRHLGALRTAGRLAERLAEETAHHLAAGLTSGTLSPPDIGHPSP